MFCATIILAWLCSWRRAENEMPILPRLGSWRRVENEMPILPRLRCLATSRKRNANLAAAGLLATSRKRNANLAAAALLATSRKRNANLAAAALLATRRKRNANLRLDFLGTGGRRPCPCAQNIHRRTGRRKWLRAGVRKIHNRTDQSNRGKHRKRERQMDLTAERQQPGPRNTRKSSSAARQRSQLCVH